MLYFWAFKNSSSAYLYLHSLVQRSVHERVERQEKGTNGVEKRVPVLAVPVESENQDQALNQSHPEENQRLCGNSVSGT